MSYTKLTDFASKDALLTGNPSKLVRGTELGAEFDAIAVADALNIKPDTVTAATGKTTPVDADLLTLFDSASTFSLKKLTWANLKATVKTYFDTLYAASGANTDITSLAAHPVGKMIAQVQTFQTGAVATGTTGIPNDNTIPQNTEGDQYMSLAITPQNASSTLEIDVVFVGSLALANPLIVALFQDSTANALAVSDTDGTAGNITNVAFKYIMTAGTTSATTFKVRAGQATGGGTTLTFNGIGGAQAFGGVLASRITIKEILP